MRSSLIILLLVGISETSKISYRTENCEVIQTRPYYFMEIYKSIRAIEGCYANHPNDKGGETYGGIPRRYQPNWIGWRAIDKAKPLQRNECVEVAEIWVLDFYLTIWVDEGFDSIKDKELALNLFDFRIHSSPKTVVRKVNKVFMEMGVPPIKFGKNWVDDRFNSIDAKEFILRLKIQRLILFNFLVTRDRSQEVFYKGWTNRLL